ncbi:MAG: HAMP domain-containing protein [Acetobacteraceae bacterium]
MRLLRHLNISTMLGLFSAIALALLGLLTWSTAVGTTDLMALRDHAQRVQMAQFATMEARGFARPLPGLAGRIVLAQNAASITQSLADADAASERAVGRLRALLDQQPNPAAVPALAKMIQSVGAYQGVIHQLATARLALLTRRNDEMEALRARFDTAVETATGAMHFEDMGATDADRWRARLIRYQRAVQRNAGVVERHLLIHDPDLLRQVQLSSEVATALIKAARTETVPDEAKDALDRMDALGQAVLACGAALLQDDAAVQAIAAGPLPTAEQTLDNDIQFVMDLSAAFVGGSVGEARSALAALTRHLAWIACSIAATLAVSGYATARVIGRPLKRMTQDVRRMAAGDTDQPVHGAESRNELGRMAAALEQLRGVVREACIQAQVVEQIPIGLLTADARDDLRITFVNQAGRAHLQALHAALGLPDADPVGDSIRHFEPFLPGLVAHHLSPDALPYSSRVQVGDDTLDSLCIRAVRSVGRVCRASGHLDFRCPAGRAGERVPAFGGAHRRGGRRVRRGHGAGGGGDGLDRGAERHPRRGGGGCEPAGVRQRGGGGALGRGVGAFRHRDHTAGDGERADCWTRGG